MPYSPQNYINLTVKKNRAKKRAILTECSFQDLFYRDVNYCSSRSGKSTFIYRIVSFMLTGL